MSKHFALKGEERAIQKKTEELFTEGALSEKVQQALELTKMQGLDVFALAMPWQIVLPQGQRVDGFSETLRHAANDLHAQFVTLARTLPADTLVSIEVDEARLPARSRVKLHVPKIEGG